MSSFQSLKSSAETRVMPGGRWSWICGARELGGQRCWEVNVHLSGRVDVGAYFGKLLTRRFSWGVVVKSGGGLLAHLS